MSFGDQSIRSGRMPGASTSRTVPDALRIGRFLGSAGGASSRHSRNGNGLFVRSDVGHSDHALKTLDVCKWSRLCEKSKTLDRDRTSCSFKALSAPTPQAHSILKSNPRISFSSRFDFLSFHTAWAQSGGPGMSAFAPLLGAKRTSTLL